MSTGVRQHRKEVLCEPTANRWTNRTLDPGVLTEHQLRLIDSYWRAANYLSVGQIYLLDNPLLPNRSKLSTSSPDCSGTGVQRLASTSSMPI